LNLPLIPGIIRAPVFVGYFPLKPTGISGVFNNPESSAEIQNNTIFLYEDMINHRSYTDNLSGCEIRLKKIQA